MGHQSFSCYGIGYTEQEAKQNALEADRHENGHQEGYSGTIGSATESFSKCIVQPKPPKKCKVERQPSGTRKWETRYIPVPSRWSGEARGIPEGKNWSKQGEALKEAKELALKYGEAFEVEIRKVLTQGVQRPLKVIPEAGQQGKWRFWGEARC